MTDKYGVVKVTTHAIERMRERFGIPKRAIRRVFKRVIEEGVVKDMPEGISGVEYGQYALRCEVVEDGRLVVLTVVNLDTMKGK